MKQSFTNALPILQQNDTTKQKQRLNMKKGLLFMLTLICVGFANATTYYSQSTGGTAVANFNTSRTGGGTTAVSGDLSTSGNIFIIQGTGGGLSAPHTVTSGSTITYGAGVTLEVEAGATLVQNSNITFNATATFKLDANSFYTHNSSGSAATVAGVESWASSATIKYTNTGFLPTANITGGAHPNVIIANASNANIAGVITNIAGNLTIQAGAANTINLTGATALTLSIGGDLILTTGTALSLGNGTATPIINLAGNLSIATGMTLTYAGSGAQGSINFTKSGTQTFSTAGTGTAAGAINYTVNSGSTLDVGTSVISGTGTFTVASGGGLTTANTAGISTTAATGSVQVTGTKTYNTAGNYTYNSTTAAQVTGNGLSGCANLTISNTFGDVTMSQAFTASGATTINSGCTLGTAGATFTSSGTVSVVGSFKINPSGFATGGTWTYNSTTGTLIYNNSTGSFGENGGSYWPTTNGPKNVTVSGAGGVTMNVARTIAGIFQTVAGITNANNLTFNGTAQINAGGFMTGTPTYGGSSTLVYNTSSYTSTGNEFPNSGVVNVTITAPSGTNTVTLNADKTITGTLTVGTHILNGGKSMNAATITIGTGSMTMGDLTTSTAFTCSGASAISLTGAWSVTGFTKSTSTVTFAGTGNYNNSTSFYNVTNSAGTRSITQNMDIENTLSVTAGQWGVTGGTGRTLTMSGATSSISIAGGSIFGTDAGAGNDLSLVVSGAQCTLSGNATASFDDEKKFFNVTVNSGKTLILSRGILCKYGTFTCNGTIQINANGYVQNDVSYGSNAKLPAYNATTGFLVYNNGGSYTAAGEWPSTSSPFNVSLQTASTAVALSGNRSIAGTLTLAGSTSLDFGTTARTLTLSGTGANTLSNGGTITMNGSNAAHVLQIAASSTSSLGTITTGTGSTINFNGTAQTVNVFNYNSLSLVSASSTLFPSGTVGIAGTFTPASITSASTGTIDFTSASAQSIPAFNYNNLSNTGNGNRTLASSGTIGVGGTYTPTSGTRTISGSTIDFTSASSQSIPATTYNNLSNSGNGARTLASSGTIAIDGTYTPTSGSRTITGSTIDFTSASSQSIPATTYNNLSNSGNGSRTLASSGTIGIAGTYTPTSGSRTITGSTVDFNGTGAQTVNATTYNNLTVSGTRTGSPTITLGSGTVSVDGALSVTATGVGSYGITGNTLDFTSASSQSIPAFNYNNLSNSGNGTRVLASSGTIGIAGTYTPTSGSRTITGSTIDFNGTGAQTVNATTYNNLTISGTRTSSPTITLASGTVSVDGALSVTATGVGSYAITGNTVDFTSASSQSIPAFNYNNLSNSGNGNRTLANSGTIGIAGTYTPTSGTRTITGSTISYNGGSAQTVTTTAYNNLTLSNSAGAALAGSTTIGGTYTASSGKLSIAGNTLTLNGTVSGMSATNSFTGSNTSKLTVSSTSSVGAVYFDQGTSADVATTNGTNALQNLLVSGSGGSVTIGNKLNLFDRLSVSNGTLTTGDVLVLRSTSSNTAYVDNVGGTISGQVVVERYMHNQARGWRALTAPVTYNGITQGYVSGNWQSAFGYTNNYGTRITGPVSGNGLDDLTPSASLQTYNSTTGAWTKITNTNTETQSGNSGNGDNKGFYIFIRGDRTVTPANSTPNAFVTTTLAAKGKLQTGTQTVTFTGASGKSWLTGNPYACPVDMSAATFNNIGNFIYVWDPTLTGYSANTTGNYAIFDRTSWGSGPNAGTTTQYFQSGQGFFAVPSSATASIVYAEGNKSSSANNNTHTSGTINNSTDIFNIKLMNVKADGSKVEVDGARAKFGNYSNTVDANDGAKWAGAGIENLSFIRDTKLLAIEARANIVGVDYLYLNLANLSVGANYEFKVNPINFDASVSSCKLVDNFLNTETPISLTSTTTIGFNVTSVVGSSAANRFNVVFNGAGSLPTNGLTVKAYKKNKTVVIDWEAIAENNVKVYNVEKSIDGTNFSKLGEAAAKNANATSNYSLIDNAPVVGVNYYRIKTIQSNSNTVYSTIVRVEMTDKGVKSITVYPNPVKGSTIGVQMSNLEAGVYTARLFNSIGQQVWTNAITHNGNNGSISLNLGKVLAAGSYQLSFTDTKGNSLNQSILVIE